MPAQLPKWVKRLLDYPSAPEGQRHTECIDLCGVLLRQGYSAEETFAQLRARYEPATFPDREIVDVINWSLGNNGVRKHAPRPPRGWQNDEPPPKPKPRTPEQQIANARRHVGSVSLGPEDYWENSPIRLHDEWRRDSITLLQSLYQPDLWVCINSDYQKIFNLKGELKYVPAGRGVTMQVRDWIDWLSSHALPDQEAGVWIRMNPVCGPWGRGARDSSHTDSDVSAFRFVLAESDALPPSLQLSVMGKLKLPIAAVIASGRRGYHFWLQVNAATAQDYAAIVDDIFSVIYPLGFDRGNKNPSRYSRFPGVVRLLSETDPPEASAEQKLIFLNPQPRPKPLF